MPLLNPNFQDAGAGPGEAAHWTLTAITRRERIAAFGVPPAAFEGFDWLSWRADLSDVEVLRASFGPDALGYKAWDLGGYLFDLRAAQTEPALFDAPGGPNSPEIEAFEPGWANSPWAREWAAVPSSAAFFEGLPHEPFEAGWRANQAFVRAWADLDTERAYFDGGIHAAEQFSDAWPSANTL